LFFSNKILKGDINMNFKRVNSMLASGTFLIGDVDARPADIIALFGKPDDGDNYKVMGEFCFQSTQDKRLIFTLYDWKMGRNIWKSTTSHKHNIHIGGNDASKKQIHLFLEWLGNQKKPLPNKDFEDDFMTQYQADDGVTPQEEINKDNCVPY
jgi:hypothetical protein